MIIVMTWNYGGLWTAGVRHRENVGHAAIRILTNNPDEPFYISWWPGEGIDENDNKRGTPYIAKTKMPDPHTFKRDLGGEGDRMRNSKEFRKFVKQLEKESKKNEMFVKTELRKMRKKNQPFNLEEWNEKLEEHKEITNEVVNSFKMADNKDVFARYYDLLTNMVSSHNYPSTLTDFYMELDPNKTNVMRPPDVNTHIPTMSDGLPCGLDDASMVEWWVNYYLGDRSDRRRYSLTKENCSTIAGYALLAGGGNIHAKVPGKAMGRYWTPKTVEKFGNNILISVAKRSKLYHQFVTETCTALDSEAIWNMRTFKKESKAGRMSHRYDALKKVDSMLDYYSRIDDQPTVQSIGEQLGILAKVVATLQQILNDRPKSKRKAAIISLGNRCIAKINKTLLPQYIQLSDVTFRVFYAMQETATRNYQETRRF